MNRKEFIQQSLTLGAGLPFLSILLQACETGDIQLPDLEIDFSGKVIVIGAGAAGLTAGYLLQRYGIDFQVLEASSGFGGRVKRNEGLADFPIDLGAEWIHEDPSVLARLVSDESVEGAIDIITYNPQTIYTWKNDSLRKHNWGSHFYSEYKFKSTTWYGFFEQYMVPSIQDQIVYNSPVVEVDYSGDKVLVRNLSGDTFEADRVLVTVPIKILQIGSINFTPQLPTAKVEAIDSITMPDGLKVFIEFSERFYPDLLFTGGLIKEAFSDEKLFYDAAFGKDTDRHILGLFSVGGKAAAYTTLTDDAILARVMDELDEIFEGKASQYYKNHVVQNWSKEPYIQGSYSIEFENNHARTVADIVEPVDNKIYFAGEALSIDNGSTVPGASESAYVAIETILQGK
jgi:monoamine oxidase